MMVPSTQGLPGVKRSVSSAEAAVGRLMRRADWLPKEDATMAGALADEDTGVAAVVPLFDLEPVDADVVGAVE